MDIQPHWRHCIRESISYDIRHQSSQAVSLPAQPVAERPPHTRGGSPAFGWWLDVVAQILPQSERPGRACGNGSSRKRRRGSPGNQVRCEIEVLDEATAISQPLPGLRVNLPIDDGFPPTRQRHGSTSVSRSCNKGGELHRAPIGAFGAVGRKAHSLMKSLDTYGEVRRKAAKRTLETGGLG